jgi:hypothetical protein
MQRGWTGLAGLLLTALALPAAAQQSGAPDPTAPRGALRCPTPAQTGQADLLGLWHAVFEGQPKGATLLLEQHPELAESVRGAINRDGERAFVAGDVGDGEFTLEESVDGQRISGTWLGTVVEGSCGREIRGNWQRAGESVAVPFRLRKLP